jgi:hypothetical protein
MSRSHSLLASLGLLTLCTCTPVLPGESLGTFTVTMNLKENTCGPQAVIVTDGRRFAAELRATDDGRAYWRVPEQNLIEGRLDEDEFRFVFTSIVARSAPDAGPQCDILQTAELVGYIDHVELDGGVPDAGESPDGGPRDELEEPVLRARYTLSIGAAPGTDCRDALAPTGVFQALPCTVDYKFTGTSRASFDD